MPKSEHFLVVMIYGNRGYTKDIEDDEERGFNQGIISFEEFSSMMQLRKKKGKKSFEKAF
jgi:hypothetical protein